MKYSVFKKHSRYWGWNAIRDVTFVTRPLNRKDSTSKPSTCSSSVSIGGTYKMQNIFISAVSIHNIFRCNLMSVNISHFSHSFGTIKIFHKELQSCGMFVMSCTTITPKVSLPSLWFFSFLLRLSKVKDYWSKSRKGNKPANLLYLMRS